ncbi:MAG: purine-binding chemotaxis protein CheW [Alteromonadaceae bacterium]|jgi:purine-binding chemotaxis protein CheW
MEDQTTLNNNKLQTSADKETTNYLTIKQLRDRAAEYALLTKENDSYNIQESSWVVFQLEQELFTINLEDIDEITTVNQGAMLPKFNPAILGLSNIHGSPMILVDMGQVLGLRNSQPRQSDKQCILLLKDVDGNLTGLLVDKIKKVMNLTFTNYDKSYRDHTGLVERVSHLDEKIIGQITIEEFHKIIRQWLSE